VSTLCLGEALVDLVCERPVQQAADADLFRPYFGGAAANVCVAAARHGATVALAGGVGDDAWGRWLRQRLDEEGVDLRWFSVLQDVQTPVAFVTVDGAGEPSFSIYGDGIMAAIVSTADRLPDAIEACDALAFASNTLVGPGERAVTLEARERALELGKRTIFDPNLRLHRWSSPEEAVHVARSCVPDSFLLKCNASEARLLTDEPDVERAAAALIAAGARQVVITLGAEGGILRGDLHVDAPGTRANVINATGAGDAFLGVLIASLSQAGYNPETLADALPRAVEEAARATERWGAI
jgi:sugar/nucleoside kinase (ribokinase family)